MSFGSILFVPSVRQTDWLLELFPERSSAEMPIAGRRIIDYQVEHALESGVAIVEIIDWHYSESVSRSFRDPERTGYSVTYRKGDGEMPRGLRDIVGIATPLTYDPPDGLYVVWGPCLCGHGPDDVRTEPVSEADLADTPMGIYRWTGGRWMRIKPGGVAIHGLKSWHLTNFAVLRAPGRFTLPCYSAEEGVHLGRNVVLEHGTSVVPPVLLQSNTWCARNVRLEGNVIVGTGSYVGEGARLGRTVVGSNTYVGTGLDLRDKIVIGNRVIDPETGAWTDIEEPGVARDIGGGFGWFKSVLDFFRGRSHGRRE